MEEKDLLSLVKEAHEAKLLKNLIAAKLRGYGGIKHDELENLCIMFNIIIPKDGDSA